jgi:hypothetical protein
LSGDGHGNRTATGQVVNKLTRVIPYLSAASIVMVVGALYRNDCANGGESVTVFQAVSRRSCLLCEGYGVDADQCWRGSHCCRDNSELVNGVLSSPPWIAYKLVQNRVLYGVGYGSSDSVSSGDADRNFYCSWSRGDVWAWGDSDGIRRNLSAAGLDVAERKRSRIWAERGTVRFLEWRRSPVVDKDNPKGGGIHGPRSRGGGVGLRCGGDEELGSYGCSQMRMW